MDVKITSDAFRVSAEEVTDYTHPPSNVLMWGLTSGERCSHGDSL